MSKPDRSGTRAFGLWGAVFLGIGSMVGAGIFIVIGEAGAVAGNLVGVSFLLSGAIALVCGYSLSRLAIRYPSRGGVIEFLVQGYGEGFLSGTFGIVFYLAQLVSIAAVAESFGTYAAIGPSANGTADHIDLLALGVLGFFVVINLAGAAVVARAENLIVGFKLAALGLFTLAALFYVDPSRLSVDESPGVLGVFSALGLTFFAYQGFSVITNAVEDMESPHRTMLRAMCLSIGLVGILYVAVSIAVFGNLPLQEIIRDRDFALAEAARPAFGDWGFRIISATAMVATASAINATLYSVTQIGYTLAKDGHLPELYEFHVFHDTEGLVISAALIVPMIVFLDLGEIATLAAVSVLLIQGFTHTGHLFRLEETGARPIGVGLAAAGSFGAAGFAVAHASKSMPDIIHWIVGMFFVAFAFEVALRLVSGRAIERQIVTGLDTTEAHSS